ncbi:putative branched-chain-amino-acid aminotransferase [Candidatus Terasakiella magnetica]|uniref:Probable branched-chain-amino-acid aminotransferase n=1 Tax=Candidatus Terasakiella magnetica TaxID=1867952 RepID=A0A1C3RLQ0_9PROT|nr:aminotransferase class IV [Candidatus Terasakiella magnetica]SCA58168.1 putative branched-chain-amino-acid aminotransferase [Candidatus Terasakiella magnetica]
MIAWFNGELLPLGGVKIPATDRGFLLGDGFFETMAAQSDHVVRFDDHMARLRKTGNNLGLKIPYSDKEIREAIHEVLMGSQLLNARGAVRLTVTRGSGPRGLMPPLEVKPEVMISASQAQEHYSAAKVKTVSVRKNEFSPSTQIKSLCYLDHIFAFEEAHAQGADEALMLNTSGHIAEGTISNIFFIKGDNLFTPRLEDGCLPGTMRSAVLDMAETIGMAVFEESLTPEIIQHCDEAFLTNSLFRVRPIHELDGRTMPAQHWCEKLLKALVESE